MHSTQVWFTAFFACENLANLCFNLKIFPCSHDIVSVHKFGFEQKIGKYLVCTACTFQQTWKIRWNMYTCTLCLHPSFEQSWTRDYKKFNLHISSFENETLEDVLVPRHIWTIFNKTLENAQSVHLFKNKNVYWLMHHQQFWKQDIGRCSGASALLYNL